MVAARNLLAAREDCRHLLVMPCMMHGFALILKSIVAHPLACAIVSDVQRVVTFFRSSHQPLAFLRACAREVNIRTGLQTSNQTRITSVHMCLESMLKLETAFKALLQRKDDPAFPPTLLERKRSWVLERLGSRTFWVKLEELCKVLEPLTRVIMAVQSAHATMADLTR
jgi:hypothetical protein